jgi:hypothetical protein
MPAGAVNAVDGSGRTAAHHAVAEGHADIVRCLLAACPALIDATANVRRARCDCSILLHAIFLFKRLLWLYTPVSHVCAG